MRLGTLVWRSLTYYWRTNLPVLGGAAIAVAVLSGALLVGDSVRASLRQLVLGRIGRTDFLLTGDVPFRSRLAEELALQMPGIAVYPMLAFEGIVTFEGRSAAKVAVYGVDAAFWKFHGVALSKEPPTGRTIALSPALAAELGVRTGESVLIRVNKPSAIPADSLHGRKEDALQAMRLTAGPVVAAGELGEFSLRPTQSGVRAVFVAIDRLRRELGLAGRANMILIAGPDTLAASQIEARLRRQVSIDDLGLRVKALPEVRHLSLESASMVLNRSLVESALKAAQQLGWAAYPTLTYLINSIRLGNREVPYSLATAVDLGLLNHQGPPGAILNTWTAGQLQARPTDRLTLEYYVWLDEGRLQTRRAEVEVAAITPIAGLAADRDFAPEYPGITQARTIHDWDPPFPIDLGKIRQVDEDYWERYRTTAKLFLPLEAGQRLWSTRFGNVTAIRLLPPASVDLEQAARLYTQQLLSALDLAAAGLRLSAVRTEALGAAEGATDFGQYFVFFSFFLLVSALLLMGLFFRLGVEQRYQEAGLLRALGFRPRMLARIFFLEGMTLAGAGAAAGSLVAVLYAALILHGLRTWWIDAVGTRRISLHADVLPIASGAAAGLATALVVIALALRSLSKQSPRALLKGGPEPPPVAARKSRYAFGAGLICTLAGLALLALAGFGILQPAAAFFLAGTLLMLGALAFERFWLARGVTRPSTIGRLGLRNAASRPGRSVLSTALIASATFLILALSAFRREAPSPLAALPPGSGGFAMIGESALPIIHSPATPEGRAELGLPENAEPLFAQCKLIPLRLRPGEDSSCLNLYQPRQPRVVGLPDAVLARFPIAARMQEPVAPGAIAAYADANSLQYVLHKKLGEAIVLDGATGRVRLQIAGTLRDSIFQSEIVIREQDFLRAFPEQSGFRMFLIEAPARQLPELAALLEDRLNDYGLDLELTASRLAQFHKVENAYLSTFQALGGLGLALGTLGLAAVLLRNGLERRKELALLRAVGYRPAHLRRLVLAESLFLLGSGLLMGASCAVLAILPALAQRGWPLPLWSMAVLLAAVFASGLLASLAAVKAVLSSPLLAALRSE